MPLGGLGPWGWRASFARLSSKPGKHRCHSPDPQPRGLARSGAPSPGIAARVTRRRRRLQGSTRGSLGRPAARQGWHVASPGFASWPLTALPCGSASGGRRHPGAAGARGAAPWRSGGSGLPARLPPRRPAGSPPPLRPTRSRSCEPRRSRGPATAAGRLVPGSVWGPRSTPAAVPARPRRSASAVSASRAPRRRRTQFWFDNAPGELKH